MKKYRIESATEGRLAIISLILLSLCWNAVLAEIQVAEAISQEPVLSQQAKDVDTEAFSKYHWDFSPSARNLQLTSENDDAVDHFDINRFLEEFDNIDCTRNSGNAVEMTNALCESRLMTDTLAPLGKASTSHEDVYSYLQNEIYQPLAHDSEKKENLADMLVDVMDLTGRELSDKNPSQEITFSGFQDGVMRVFDELSTKTNDVKANEDQIRSNSVDILKKFHLYWNLLRTQGQLDQVKEDTKQVIQTLILNYKVKKEFQNVVLKALLRAIVKAYYRFLKAHKILTLINRQGDQIIINQIISRYQNIMEKILGGSYSDIFLVKEAAYMISLMQGFFVVSFKQGVADSIIKTTLGEKIIDPIRAIYEEKESELENDLNDAMNLVHVRDFTAVTLLKFRHMSFIMCNVNDLTHYINMPQVNFIRTRFAIKLYYRLFDSFYLIPQKCSNFLLLKRCAVMEASKILRSITSRLGLRRSTFGWYFLQEINSMMKSLFSKIDDTTWQNWGLFKEYYYQNLFSVMYNYKKVFQVNDMDVVENLEQLVSDAIEKYRQNENVSTNVDDLQLFEKLDRQFYNKFVNLKAKFNGNVSLERNELRVMNLKKALYTWIMSLKIDPKFKSKKVFVDFFNEMMKLIDGWTIHAITDDEMSFNIGPPALAPTVQEFTIGSNDPTNLQLTPTPSVKALASIIDEKQEQSPANPLKFSRSSSFLADSKSEIDSQMGPNILENASAGTESP